jgi:hypothetical protein
MIKSIERVSKNEGGHRNYNMPFAENPALQTEKKKNA